MTKTASNMLPLGTIAPDFTLPDTISGKNLSLTQLRSEVATVVIFMCNHCPFVKHLNSEMVSLANEYLAKDVSFIAINANDIKNYPQDGPIEMSNTAKREGYPFPYLFDETQEVAKAYQAACTPDFYIFDKNLKCIYRGQFDDSRPGNDIPVTGNDLRQALDAILQNKPITITQKPSLGCNIKWRD